MNRSLIKKLLASRDPEAAVVLRDLLREYGFEYGAKVRFTRRYAQTLWGERFVITKRTKGVINEIDVDEEGVTLWVWLTNRVLPDYEVGSNGAGNEVGVDLEDAISGLLVVGHYRVTKDKHGLSWED